MRSKRRYDKSTKCSKLEPGHLVLVRKKGFQDKHKILDRWEWDPYEVVKQRQDGLPVFVVTNNGKEQVLHHSMLLLLNYHREIGSDVGSKGESELLLTPEQIQDDVTSSDLDDQPIYQGPQTRSRTKALMKANLVMNECFHIDEMFQPERATICREPIHSLIVQFCFYRPLAFTILSVICLKTEHILVVK